MDALALKELPEVFDSVIDSGLCRSYAFPSSRSTTQHPRACGPSPRQWASTSALSHPASSRASARIGSRSNARSA